MKPLRTIPCECLIATVLAGAAQGVAFAEDPKGSAFKISIGGQLLTQSSGIASSWAPDLSEDDGGVLASLTYLRRDKGRYPYGICMELDGNVVDVGPPIGLAGIQTFGIATVRTTGLVEFRFRDPRAVDAERRQPYASVGAGWSFHRAGSKIAWPVAPPPAGTPLALKLDESPAVRVAVGFNHRTRGVSFNLEVGWKWDAGNYRVLVQGEPERRGSYDLSGTFFLFGVNLRG